MMEVLFVIHVGKNMLKFKEGDKVSYFQLGHRNVGTCLFYNDDTTEWLVGFNQNNDGLFTEIINDGWLRPDIYEKSFGYKYGFFVRDSHLSSHEVNAKSDFEYIKNMLDSKNLTYEIDNYKDHNSLTVEGNGYIGFSTTFTFDLDGIFLDIGAYE